MKKKVSPAEKKTQPSTRPPLVRMLKIHEQIKSGKYPNCSQLGGLLEISYKTIQRDIDFMKYQWEMPIEYDAVHHGFYYSKPVTALPTMTVTGGELVALLVAHKAVEQYRGTPFEKPIISAFEKLAASMNESEGVSVHQLAEAFSFKPSSLAHSELEAFSLATDAVMKSRELAFDYHGLSGQDFSRRRLEPYHLGCISDQWYLIGNDPEKSAIRTFAISRMTRLEATGRVFLRPKDFDVGKFFAGSFSAFQAKKTEKVSLLLDPLAARIAAERKWHNSQKLETSKKGETILTMEVGLAPDLESWVLSWGEHAKVLAPESLRKNIAKRLKEAAKIYKKPEKE